MTLRARPVARRRGRAGWDSGDRRNSLINAGFFLAIGISVVLLIGYAAYSWYDDHFGAAATVDGEVITKDDLLNRLAIESFRLDYIESRIQTLLAKGRMSTADARAQIDFLNQRRNQLANLTLDRLVDVALMTTLGTENGVQVDDAEVDEQLRSEATTSEQRHVWMIEVEATPNPTTGEAGDDEKRAALGRAQRALAQLKRGESWEDVARTTSGSGLAAQAGDLGWLSKDSGYDQKIMDAVFAVALNEPTQVIVGDDGIYRIARATEQAAAEVDVRFEALIADAEIDIADYRVAARADVVRQKLSDKVVADMGKPGLQRQVLEIYLPEPNESTVAVERGVKVRWIVFAPKDNMGLSRSLPADDPSWATAKADADAVHADIKANPEKFDQLARTSSDESTGRVNGGKQRWIYASTPIDQPIKSAVLVEGLTPGQLLEPVKGELGWYVVQFMRPTGDGEDAWLGTVRSTITDDASFKQAARDNSEAEEAADGGDIGWIAKGQLVDLLDTAVFATGIGAMSSIIPVEGDGTYLLKVLKEETQTPTEEQLKIFEQSGFQYWYTQQKEAADIDYNLASTPATG